MQIALWLLISLVALVGCDGLGGTRETKVSITGPGPIKCIAVEAGKQVTQDCPDTVTPAPVVVPPVVVPPVVAPPATP